MYASAAACAMGRTVVEPVTVILCFCAEVVDAVVVTEGVEIAVVAVTAACVAMALAGVDVAEGVAVDVVVPVLVQPATNIDTMSNAARHTVTNTYELWLGFMVFDHHIIPDQYTVFRHRIYRYIYKKGKNRDGHIHHIALFLRCKKDGNTPGTDDRGVIVCCYAAKRLGTGNEDQEK